MSSCLDILKIFHELLNEGSSYDFDINSKKIKEKAIKKEVYQEQLSNRGVKLLAKLSNATHHYTGVYDLFKEHNSLTINVFVQNVS